MTRWTTDQLAEYMTQRQQQVDDHKPDDGPESRLQGKCLGYLREHGYLWFHDYSKKRNSPGFPDLLCFLPKGRIVMIELKSGNAKLRKEQQEVRLKMKWLGHEIHVVRSFKRFIEIMKGEK